MSNLKRILEAFDSTQLSLAEVLALSEEERLDLRVVREFLSNLDARLDGAPQTVATLHRSQPEAKTTPEPTPEPEVTPKEDEEVLTDSNSNILESNCNVSASDAVELPEPVDATIVICEIDEPEPEYSEPEPEPEPTETVAEVSTAPEPQPEPEVAPEVEPRPPTATGYEHKPRYAKWSKELVVQEIQRLHRNGADLSSGAVHKCWDGLYVGARKLFGSWQAAVQAAGFDLEGVRRKQLREKRVQKIAAEKPATAKPMAIERPVIDGADEEVRQRIEAAKATGQRPRHGFF